MVHLQYRTIGTYKRTLQRPASATGLSGIFHGYIVHSVRRVVAGNLNTSPRAFVLLRSGQDNRFVGSTVHLYFTVCIFPKRSPASLSNAITTPASIIKS